MIVITVALVLFAGISSRAIAEEQIPSQLESAANSNGDSPQPLEYVELLKKECPRNGGPEAYHIFEQSEQFLIGDCVSETLNGLKPENWIAATPLREIDEPSFGNGCLKFPKFKSCFRNSTEDLKGCYEPKDREAVNVISNAIGGLVDFLCTSDENFIQRFLANGGAVCAISEMPALRNCVRQNFVNYVIAGATGQGRLQPPQNFTEKTISENYLLCLETAMRKCKTPGPADVLNSLYHSFKERMRF